MAQSLCYLKGTGTIVICCHQDQVLQIADIEDRVKLKVPGLKDRASLLAELERRGESCDADSQRTQAKIRSMFAGGTVKRVYQRQGKRSDIIH